MIGQPVWGAEQGYGSFLSLQFGSPKLIVKEWQSASRGQQRRAYVQGDWTVWIYCCEWRFLMQGSQIAWSEDSRDDIARATGILNGQKLIAIQTSRTDGRSTLRFDLGGLLETWPVGDDSTEEQWFIYSSDEVFGFRADGHFSRQLPDTPREKERWAPLG
nr:hypothetical protein [Sphingomonas sp.]